MQAAPKGKGHNGRDRGRGRWYRLGGWRKGRLLRQSQKDKFLSKSSDKRGSAQEDEATWAGGLWSPVTAPGDDAKAEPGRRQASQGDCPSLHPTKKVRCGYPSGHRGKKHYRRLGSARIYWPR